MKSLFAVYSAVAATTIVSISLVALPQAARSNGLLRRCGTPSPTLIEAKRADAAVQRFLNTTITPNRAVDGATNRGNTDAPSLITVDVYFHVITNDAGTEGVLTDEQINEQIAILNKGFDGTDSLPTGVPPLGPNIDTKFRFVLKGIDRTANSAWFAGNDDFGMKSRLRKGNGGTLNVYSSNIGSIGLLGFATFPSWYKSDPVSDGVVIAFDSMPGFPGPFGLGKTLTHEVGHWVGLYHTFQDGCTKYNDFVNDTAAQAGPFFGDWFAGGSPGAIPDTCSSRFFPGKDPVDNYMDYSNDASYTRFTAGQTARMTAYCRFYRGL